MALLETAVNAEKNLEQLATGLAEAGADPQAVKAVSQMAEVVRKVIKALGRGQENTGDQEPPAEQPSENEEPQQPKTFDEATNSMMNERRA